MKCKYRDLKQKIFFLFICVFFSPVAISADIYNGSFLQIPKVLVGTTIYKEVAVKIKDILSVSGGTPATSHDAFVLQTGQLYIPSVTAFGNTYTNVTVTLAEVISVGGTESACISPSNNDSFKYRIAEVDMRFDQPSDFTPNGLLVNSYENVVPMIDKIKCLGFDTVQLTTNIPIDIETGSLMLIDPDPTHSNRDKNIPKDFWKLAIYAKKQGLRVFIQPCPVYYADDTAISPYFVKFGTNFSYAKFFQTLNEYGTDLARKSEEVGADGFFVGVFQLGMDTEEYSTQWDGVVQSYRKVYKGKLIYQSCFQCTSPVMQKVDLVSLAFSPILIRTKSYDINSILKSYEATKDDAQHGGSVNAISLIQKNYATYKKPIILTTIINAGDNAVGAVEDFWTKLNNGSPLSSFQPDYALQALRFAALFELIATNLSKEVSGVSVFQFMPWKDADWIVNPPSACQNCQRWNTHSIIASIMNRNEAVHQVFRETFIKPWGTRLH
jgi:hypothetical protein